LHPWATAAFMAGIRGGRGITTAKARRERIGVDVSIPAAIPNR